MVHNSLCKLFADKNIYDTAKNPCEDALLKSGLNSLDEFKRLKQLSNEKEEEITYTSPPYCDSIKTKVRTQLLNSIKTDFSKLPSCTRYSTRSP